MFKFTTRPVPPWMELVGCGGRHPRHWATCDPRVLACHYGPAFDEDGLETGENRVLAYFPMLKGSTVVRHLDLSEVHDSYKPGTRAVALHVNEGLFTDEAGQPVTVYAVSAYWGVDDAFYVALFDDADAASAVFEDRAIP